jgi:hypothetical protein
MLQLALAVARSRAGVPSAGVSGLAIVSYFLYKDESATAVRFEGSGAKLIIALLFG